MVPLNNIKDPAKYRLEYFLKDSIKIYTFVPIEKDRIKNNITGYCYSEGIRTFKCANIKKMKRIA